uniref:Uncharacterized protein n=1 Tax=Myotis myotis TaxID=51298 RepID=A0A7J7XHH5_MYOMY|nr:hypothetical protein mMyoMyo1_011670 [Myotis myotis]
MILIRDSKPKIILLTVVTDVYLFERLNQMFMIQLCVFFLTESSSHLIMYFNTRAFSFNTLTICEVSLRDPADGKSHYYLSILTTATDINVFFSFSKQFVILKIPGAHLLCETITLEFSRKKLRHVAVL